MDIADIISIKLASIIEDLKDCEQNPKWHSEGNVYNHTMLVVDKISDMLDDTFSEEDKDILMLSAFLHDIGKPFIGKINGKKHPEDNWNSVKGHAEAGAPLAYNLCKELGYDENSAYDVAWLVRNHMIAHELETQPQEVIDNIISHRLFPKLVLLARADERGSKTTVPDERGGIDNALKVLGIKYG